MTKNQRIIKELKDLRDKNELGEELKNLLEEMEKKEEKRKKEQENKERNNYELIEKIKELLEKEEGGLVASSIAQVVGVSTQKVVYLLTRVIKDDIEKIAGNPTIYKLK